MTKSTAKVAIIGFGTIGSGVARLLLEQGERIARQAGRPVELVQIVDPDLKRPRNITPPPGMLTNDLSASPRRSGDRGRRAADRRPGARPLDHAQGAGKRQERDHGQQGPAGRAWPGAVRSGPAAWAGRSPSRRPWPAAFPIIAAINQSLTANQIQSIHAILNGTSNFILTQMEDQDTTYADALAEAQQLGYAEANPAMDVNGSDAAQKLAILAHLAFGARVHWKDIPRMGIDTVDVADMRYARSWATASSCWPWPSWCPRGLELHVSPTLVRHRSPLAQVDGAFNAIRVVGDAVGRVFFHGLGRRPDAHRFGLRGRPDRYDAGPHGDHLPHAQALVRQPRGAGGPARSGQCARPLLPALQRRRPARRDGRDRRHPRPAQDLHRLADPARDGRGETRRRRAAGHHDAHGHRRRDAAGHGHDQLPGRRCMPAACGCACGIEKAGWGERCVGTTHASPTTTRKWWRRLRPTLQAPHARYSPRRSLLRQQDAAGRRPGDHALGQRQRPGPPQRAAGDQAVRRRLRSAHAGRPGRGRSGDGPGDRLRRCGRASICRITCSCTATCRKWAA